MSRHRFISWGVALCCLIVLSLPARGAATAFLKVDGIKGDSQDKAHPQQIEIASFSAGVTQNVSATAGGGMAAGKAAIAPFTVTKAIDSSSPQFFLYTCNGKHIPTVVLELVSAGETQQPILRYTLTDAIVASVQTSGGGGGAGAEKPSEQISFAFSKIGIEFMGQNEKGAAGAKQEVMWDLKTQKGASASPTDAPDGSAAAAATAAPDAGTAGAGAAAAAGGAAGAAPAAGGAAPAAGATDPAAAPPAAGSKTLTRAQRERMKLQQPQPGQVAPAQPK